MSPQLERIAEELDAAQRRAHDLAAPLTHERWSTRPSVDEWSVAECLIHLSLTSRAMLPLIEAAIAKGRASKLLPAAVEPKDAVLGAFDTLQEQLRARIVDADGLDLGRLRVVSPFNTRLTYNLYACLRISPAHQRRHLRQADEVIAALTITR